MNRIDFSAGNADRCAIVETDIRARKLMSRDAKMTYSAAVRAVFEDDRDLCRAYVDAVPPLHANQEGGHEYA
jgi:hypothetical protein